MISFAKIMRQVLTETMSFRDLLQGSESGRKQRARTDVNVKPMRVTTMDGKEAWTFSYKSSPSTTGNRWHGNIQFLKGTVSEKDSAEDLDCRVSCNCPDYRFRYAYNNYKAGSGNLGNNNGRAPRPRSQGGVGDYGNGMCKHLLALGKYLQTQISTPEAPEPDDKPPMPEKKPIQKPMRPAVAPQTIQAPDPDEDSYTDTRSGSDTLQESKIYELMLPLLNNGTLYNRIDQFAKKNPEFEVMYEDD